MSKYIFCDTNKEIIAEFENAFQSRRDSIVYNGKFTDFFKYNPREVAFVCPMTSLGYINNKFVEEFPLLPDLINQKIQQHGTTNLSGDKFIEIGSAISVLYDEETRFRVLCVSTMYTPQDISLTENIFYAFLAVKNLVQKINIKYPDDTISTVICPSLANDLDPKYMVEQMEKALRSVRNRDFRIGIPYIYFNNDACKDQEMIDENLEFLLSY